jgi:hypothetical protein
MSRTHMGVAEVCITPLILNIDARWGEWSLPAPVNLLPVPNEREAG